MADSRKNKKSKSDATEAPTEDAPNVQHEKLTTIQTEIEKLNDEATEEILQIEKRYNGLRKPYYKKRNDVIREIPDFWLKAFLNHDMLADLLDEEDQNAFKHLKELNVEDFDDVKSGFKISLTFDSNPYFKNKTLSKTFQYDEEGILTVIPTKIDWKEGMDLTKREKGKDGNKRTQYSESESFFNWFSDEDQDLELGELIKEDLWPNPGKYYHGLTDEEDQELEGDEEEAEVEGDEEGEDEEGGEEEAEEQDRAAARD